jgi:hypothetical protein
MNLIEVDGTTYRLAYQRRRYGQTTYTWVEVSLDGKQWLSLGDPWPFINPVRAEVVEFIRYHKEKIHAAKAV